MYLEKFVLPINSEEMLLNKNADENGGYIDNSYPCGIFSRKKLYDIARSEITRMFANFMDNPDIKLRRTEEDIKNLNQ